jgi:hypothetical protein
MIIRYAAPVIAFCLLGTAAAAQEARDRRDLTGFWSPAFEQVAMDPEMLEHVPENTVVLDDAGVVEYPPGEYGPLNVKPEALAKAADWKPADELSLQRVCATPSVIYTMQGPFPFEIHQTSDALVFKLEYFDQVRVVYMDGREHPPADAPHSNLGHSIAWWEGDELVIDTTHIAPSTLTNNGLDHSQEVHFVERYKLSEDGNTLKSTQWFEDPAVLNNAGVRYMEWTARPGEYVYPYSCDPTFAVDYSQVDEGADISADEFETIE